MEEGQKQPLEGSQNEEQPDSKQAALVKPSASNRGELSAQALGRMLGLVTVNDVQILETKVDLLASKVNQLTVKMEKLLNAMTKAPTGADLERIDIQIGTLKAVMVDFVGKHTPPDVSEHPPRRTPDAQSPNAAEREEGKPGEKKRVTLSSLNS